MANNLKQDNKNVRDIYSLKLSHADEIIFEFEQRIHQYKKS